MITIATNELNDIYTDASGNLAMITNINALANVAKNVILTAQGEPQYNQESGIPYFETIFCDTPQIDLFQAAQIEALENIEDINRVTNYSYKQENGVFSYTVTIDTNYGDIQING